MRGPAKEQGDEEERAVPAEDLARAAACPPEEGLAPPQTTHSPPFAGARAPSRPSLLLMFRDCPVKEPTQPPPHGAGEGDAACLTVTGRHADRWQQLLLRFGRTFGFAC